MSDRLASGRRRWATLLALAALLGGLWHASEGHVALDAQADCHVCLILGHAVAAAAVSSGATVVLAPSLLHFLPARAPVTERRLVRHRIRPPPAC
jgi:hypothetical protein